MGSTRRTRTLEERVLGFLSRCGVPGGARILVAFSGGPDSRALLELLHELSASYPLELSAAYLDHGLRPEEERRDEAAFVRRCCGGLGIALVEESLEPDSLACRARRERRSLEEAARVARYRFLRGALRRTGSSYLALGHNLDDHVETLVMRFFQGAGMVGLRGIPKSRGALLRPLRSIARSEIEAWLTERGLEYRLDSTNRDLSILRNAVRHRLLPVAVAIFPGCPGALERFSRTMEGVSALLRKAAGEALHWRAEARGWSIDGQEFFRAPHILRLQSLYDRIDRLGMHFRRIPRRFFDVLGEPERLTDRRVLLAGHGLALRRRGERLFLERDVVGDGEKGYFIRVRSGSAVVVPEAELVLALSRVPAPMKPAREQAGDGTEGGGGAESAAVSLAEPPVFRSAQTGDCIQTRNGYKSLRKLFGEWKVPHGERWKIPIVDSRGGILAVLGGPLGYPDRFRWGLPEGLRSSLKRVVGDP